MSTHRQRRKDRRNQSEDRPPGRYVAWALLAIVALSVVGAGASFAVMPAGTAAVILGSSAVTAALTAGVWAILQNVRQINQQLQADE